MKVSFSYLDRQFGDIDPYLEDIRELMKTGDLTLGKAVGEFEEKFAALNGAKYAVGVGTGTDALALPLKALGVGPGDEVITAANTFVATVGAIAMNGATPVYADIQEEYSIDPESIKAKITEKTKAIMPVHWAGTPAPMEEIMQIAEEYNLKVVEDAAQGILGKIAERHVSSFGAAAGFSLHPLKNLNVWGDGGVVLTNDEGMRDELRYLRNHGLEGRDTVVKWGHNSRLDSLHAVIGNRLIGETEFITNRRIEIAERYDREIGSIKGVYLPPRDPRKKRVYHLYLFEVDYRDELYDYLLNAGIRAKIHYPIPMHLQPASKDLGYKEGDFPVTEAHCKRVITLPAHQHLTDDEVTYVIEQVKKFYQKKNS